MIALVLGGAPSVWDELAAAQALLAGRPHSVVATNLAGIHHQGRLDGWATLHADLIGGWRQERAGNPDYRTFIGAAHRSCPDGEVVGERWNGSSGLYALQVALFDMGAPAAILCGVPMDQEAGHFINPGSWAGVSDYRQAFAAALPLIGGRTRSLGGWTRDLFGEPRSAWLDAMATAKPLGITAPQHQRNTPMYKVENTSKETQSFKATRPDGELVTERLAPGESDKFDINPLMAAFNNGTLTVTPITADARAEFKQIDPKTGAPLPPVESDSGAEAPSKTPPKGGS